MESCTVTGLAFMKRLHRFALQGLAHQKLLVRHLGGVPQKHADEEHPHPADDIAADELQDAQEDEADAERGADAGRDPGGPPQVVFGAPEDGAQHPPAVQGEGRQEVKGRQDAVDVGDVIDDGD